MLPKEIIKFIEVFEKLPSIGPRQAIRLAFRIINKEEKDIHNIEMAVSGLKNIKLCAKCFFIHTNKNNICDICKNKPNINCIFMIVEKETDLLTIEKTGSYDGKYLVLGNMARSGLLEQWQRNRIEILKSNIKNECGAMANEIIIAFNPTTYGDLGSSIISKELSSYAKKITRLGIGMPTGGEIEFSDKETLSSSIKRRQ